MYLKRPTFILVRACRRRQGSTPVAALLDLGLLVNSTLVRTLLTRLPPSFVLNNHGYALFRLEVSREQLDRLGDCGSGIYTCA